MEKEEYRKLKETEGETKSIKKEKKRMETKRLKKIYMKHMTWRKLRNKENE